MAAYSDNDSRYYAITVLTGSHYREDNKRVYEELKLTMINGPGWAFIKRFERTQDGRSAVLAIKQQAEGRSATDSRKQQAYSQIATARYSGPRRNWNFQNYVERHQGGHNELADLNEPVPETKKVTDFLSGITDSRLTNAKDIVLGNPQYLSNFEACQQYLATLVGNKMEQAKIERQISEIKIKKKGGGGGGDKDKGKGKEKDKKLHAGGYSYRAPIVWFSKRQNTVESSTFGSEFVALRIAVDLIEALRYKLRMFGIPIDGPASVLCDNKSVVTNTTAPESVLKKKHNSINYHRCREAQVAETISVAWVDTKWNLADIATKVLPGPQRKQLLRMILW